MNNSSRPAKPAPFIDQCPDVVIHQGLTAKEVEEFLGIKVE
jgi:hypothetical protein